MINTVVISDVGGQKIKCKKVLISHLHKAGTARGTSMAQPDEYLTPDFSSGHDLTVLEFKPRVGLSAIRTTCLGSSVSLSPFAPPRLACALSLSKIK